MTNEDVDAVELLATLAFATTVRLETHATAADLSLQQFRLLGILTDREPTINELADRMGVDKSSMSGAVVRAERRGLVERVPDQHDGRSVRVRLLPTGRSLVAAASAQFQADTAEVFAALSPRERSTWATLTSKLLTADERRGLSGPPPTTTDTPGR